MLRRMFAFFTKPENRSRLIVLNVAIGCLVLALGVGGWFFYYKPLRMERLVQGARAAIDRGDFAEASLNVRSAMQAAPDSPVNCALMAEICDKTQNPDAVSWYGRIAELTGNNADALIQWGATALKYRKYPIAEKALARVPEEARRRVDFLAAAAAVDFEAGRYEEAERNYEAAVRLEPANATNRMGLATVKVRSSDFFARDEARHLLGEMASDGKFAVEARRALVSSYEATDEPNAALRESERLVETAGHSFLDRLTRVRLLYDTGDERFSEALTLLQSAAAPEAREAGAIIVWMSSVGLGAQAVEWATKRAPKVGKMPDVRQALAACYLTLKDWEAVQRITQDGPWKRGDYIRHAYRSRALRELGNARVARTEWTMAMSAAAGHPEALVWLSKIAADANWSEEIEEALWTAIDNVPDPMWAIGKLGNQFHGRQDTDALRRLAARFVAKEPANANAQNDFAFLSLLLGKDVSRATVIAHELYKKHPENAAYASTYAFALYCSDRVAEALKVLDALPKVELEKPAIAAYYGVVLAANGTAEKARKYLELGNRARLLPEEAALVAHAAETIQEETTGAK